MRYLIPVLLLAVSGPCMAAYKCTGAGGKVEYSDAPCPADTKASSTVKAAPNSVDTSAGHAQNARAVAEEECDAAKLTYKFNDTIEYRDRMRKACGFAAPPARQREHTTCTSNSGYTNCITR